MTTDAHLLVDIRDGIALLTMNRPERLNALSQDMIDRAIDHLERVAADPAVGCIVLTGAGRGFCAGGDVKAMGGSAVHEMSLEQQVDRQRRIHRLSALLHDSPKVSIAAINGPCAGAGFGLALACDLRLAADSATFTTAFAKVGFAGDFGITWPLARALGEARAKELLFLSEVLTAPQAAEPGPAEPRAARGRADARRAAAGRAHCRRSAGRLPLHEGKRARRRHRELPAAARPRRLQPAAHRRHGRPPRRRRCLRRKARAEIHRPLTREETRMRIRQIVFAAADLQAGAATLGTLLGMAAPYRDPGVAEFGLDNAVFVFGDQFVEIVSPTRSGTTAGRLIERRGD